MLDDLAGRYVWWSESRGPADDLIVAQVMNFGTYDDIRRIEKLFTPNELRAILVRAPAGQFSARSWSFWRGRLQAEGCTDIPETPPRRFADGNLL